MKILAIDPGTTESAYVVMNDLQIVAAYIVPNRDLLAYIINVYHDMPAKVDVMAIEMMQGLGMPVGKETFETVWWIGRFCQACGGIPFHRIYRKDVKLHICGDSRVKDANIRQALLDKLGPQGTKKEPGPTYGLSRHMWAALAVGVTFLEAGTRAEKTS